MREQFQREYKGSLAELENTIEKEYILVMEQNCHREHSYRECRYDISIISFFTLTILIWYPNFQWTGEQMIEQARNSGGEIEMGEARALKLPSCENLKRIEARKFMNFLSLYLLSMLSMLPFAIIFIIAQRSITKTPEKMTKTSHKKRKRNQRNRDGSNIFN